MADQDFHPVRAAAVGATKSEQEECVADRVPERRDGATKSEQEECVAEEAGMAKATSVFAGATKSEQEELTKDEHNAIEEEKEEGRGSLGQFTYQASPEQMSERSEPAALR